MAFQPATRNTGGPETDEAAHVVETEMRPTAGSRNNAPVVIKKYANRRLYNTATSCYVTLDHLCRMVKEGNDFVVYDARSGEDITRPVLTQIIFEEEGKGQNMLPIQFLRQLIRFYGDNLQTLVPGYLEMSMEAFARNQEQMRSTIADAFGGKRALEQFEETARQNFVLFERALRMFSPFSRPPGREAEEAPNGREPAAAEDQGAQQLREMQERLETMQKQIDELVRRK
jgi:polyhydroxyalkanoate synthesis repressor PhaR